MNWTRADLERKLAENPALTLECPQGPTGAILRGARCKSRSKRHEDVADVLLAHIRLLAPALYERCDRDRKFGRCRIDIAIGMVAVEVDGGNWKPGGGKHGSDRDHQKIRRLTRAGYTVLVFTAHEVRTNPAGVVAELVEVAGD